MSRATIIAARRAAKADPKRVACRSARPKLAGKLRYRFG